MDWQIVAALGTAGGFTLAFATFWIRFGSRISTAESVATEAQKASDHSRDQLAILTAQFSLYREQIAREYIHREVMREVEERLTQAIDRLGDRLDRVLERSDR